MVLYTVIWNPVSNALGQKPTVSIYHSFAGKHVRVTLLSWSGAVTYAGSSHTQTWDPIRIEFADGFQSNGMGAIASQNGTDPAYIYPNCFYTDPILGFEADPAAAEPDRQVIAYTRHKEPAIQGVMVGNVISISLSVATAPINEVPNQTTFSYVRNQFYYYKAEFDIEEI